MEDVCMKFHKRRGLSVPPEELLRRIFGDNSGIIFLISPLL